MRRIKFRKKTRKRLLLLLPVILVFLAAGWILFHPAVMERVEYKIFSVESEEELESYTATYAVNDADHQKIRKSNEKMTDNIDDYCVICLDFYFLNLLPFDIYSFFYTIEGEDGASSIVGIWRFGMPPILVSGWSDGKVSGIDIFFYRDGKTDGEVIEYLNNITIYITYKSKVSSNHNMTIKLGDYLTERPKRTSEE